MKISLLEVVELKSCLEAMNKELDKLPDKTSVRIFREVYKPESKIKLLDDMVDNDIREMKELISDLKKEGVI